MLEQHGLESARPRHRRPLVLLTGNSRIVNRHGQRFRWGTPVNMRLDWAQTTSPGS